MSVITEIARVLRDQFVALILDNEVTVGEFVVQPPLPWLRLVQENGVFRVAQGYPTVLSAAQAKFEMKNWDQVSGPSIQRRFDGNQWRRRLCAIRQQCRTRPAAGAESGARLDHRTRRDYLCQQSAGEKNL